MTTCGNCGTTFVDERTTCLVCGEELVPDDAAARHPDDTPDTDATTHETGQDVNATEHSPSSADDTDDTEVAAPDASDPDSSVPPAEEAVTDQASAAPAAAVQPPSWPDSDAADDSASTATQPPSPDAVAVDSTARNWGLLSHVSGFVASSIFGLGFLGPLAVWLIKRDDHPFVAHNAAEAFNFQLSMFLYGLLLIVASLPVITLVATVPLGIIGFGLWVVLPIVAAIKAANGESWRYPLTIGFLRP